MGDTALIGFRNQMIPVPGLIWRMVVSRDTRKLQAELSFMSEEHHLVRNYVVEVLPRVEEPLSAEYLTEQLNIPMDRMQVILDDLEKHMTFLCRYGHKSINWAYPVTVDETPHQIAYSTGEQGYAA